MNDEPAYTEEQIRAKYAEAGQDKGIGIVHLNADQLMARLKQPERPHIPYGWLCWGRNGVIWFPAISIGDGRAASRPDGARELYDECRLIHPDDWPDDWPRGGTGEWPETPRTFCVKRAIAGTHQFFARESIDEVLTWQGVIYAEEAP